MNITKTMKTLFAAALLVIGMSASANFIEGEITVVGAFAPTGGDGSIATATGIDFVNDSFLVLGATDNFADAGIALGDMGTYYDFTFDPLAAGTTIWEIAGFSFALETISVSFNGTTMSLQGSGMLSGNGYHDTTGAWSLTAQGFSSLFSFSSSSITVSEPATLALVGLGFIGLAVARRRS